MEKMPIKWDKIEFSFRVQVPSSALKTLENKPF